MEYSKKNIHKAESDLSQVASLTLLQSLPVMGNFLEIVQGFKETKKVFSTSFQFGVRKPHY